MSITIPQSKITLKKLPRKSPLAKSGQCGEYTAFLAVFKRLRQAQAPNGTYLSRLSRHRLRQQPAWTGPNRLMPAHTGLDQPRPALTLKYYFISTFIILMFFSSLNTNILINSILESGPVGAGFLRVVAGVSNGILTFLEAS